MGHWMTRGVLGFVVLALVAAACGTGGSEFADQGPTTTTVATTTTEAPSTVVTETTEADRPRATQGTRRNLRNSESTTTTTLTAGETTTTTSADVGTTTTTQPTTTTIPSGEGVGITGTIGVIGCSNTDDSAQGYDEASTLNLLSWGPLGGGSLTNWGTTTREEYPIYWGFYDERRPADGYDGAWVQVCIRGSEMADATLGQADMDRMAHVIDQIKARDPSIPIWISPMNAFVEVCPAVGEHGQELSANAVNWAVANISGVSQGPLLGPLAPNQTRDGCHPNKAGRALIGAQLVAFFDGT